MRTLMLTVVVRALLPLRPLAAVRRMARRLAAQGGRSSPLPAEMLERAAISAASRVPGAHCLARAVVAEALLRAQGEAATLVLGLARPGSEGLEAHAWVECDGRILVPGGSVEGFAPVPVP